MIREAVEPDIPQLLEWGRSFSRFSPVGYSDDDTGETLRAMIETPGFVIFRGEAGAIGGAAVPHPFNRAHVMGEEIFWWSEGGEGLRLLSAFEEWARENCHSLRLSCFEANRRVGGIYERRGYEPLEHAYMKVF